MRSQVAALGKMNPRPGTSLVQRASRLSPAEALYYCVILTLPFDELVGIAGFSITKVVGLVFFVFSIPEWRTFYGKVPRALVVLLVFIAISVGVDLATYAEVNFFAINQFSRPILVWWLMLAGYNLAINERFARVVWIMYVASLVFAFYQSLGLGGSSTWTSEEVLEGEQGARVAVLGSDANFASMFIALSVLFGLAHGLNLTMTRLGYRVLFLIGAGIGFYAILKTGSRGGLLALGGGVLSLGFTGRQWKRTAISMFAAVCIFLAMGVAVVNNPFLAARFRSSAKTGETSGRFEIWEKAVQLSVESPLYGFGSFMHSFKLGKELGRVQRGTHNLFLSVLLGSGFAGLLCFLYFYACAFKAAWSCRAQATGRIVFAWFALALLAGMSVNMESMKWFWIVLALSLAADKVYARHRTRLPSLASRSPQVLLFRRVPARPGRAARHLEISRS